MSRATPITALAFRIASRWENRWRSGSQSPLPFQRDISHSGLNLNPVHLLMQLERPANLSFGVVRDQIVFDQKVERGSLDGQSTDLDALDVNRSAPIPGGDARRYLHLSFAFEKLAHQPIGGLASSRAELHEID